MGNAFKGKRVLLAFPDENGLVLSSKLADEIGLACAGSAKSFDDIEKRLDMLLKKVHDDRTYFANK